jgi:hypothetical protein
MKALANALVYAVAYISMREGDDLDSDVGAIESIAAELRLATKEELALADEQKDMRRKEFIREYQAWMETMFGEGWEGNRRIE